MPRNALSFKNKLELIECFEKEKLSVKQLQERFKCGKTQVYEAIKKKEEIKKELEKGISLHYKRKTPSYENEELNRLVWEWFLQTRSKNLPLSGPIVQEKAKEIAVSLGKHDFKASNGWLESFKSRHYVVWNSVAGESNDVDVTVEEDWNSIIQRRIKDFKPCDVYSGHEAEIFFRAPPSIAFCMNGGKCKVGKDSKERLTLFVCGNMFGELLMPMVIGNSAQHKYFGNLDMNKLSVTWKHNDKALNTTSIMEEWMESFNLEMKKKGRKVILFLENTTFHPKIHLTNVELVCFPANMSSFSQPMNQGVIGSLKALYRKNLMQSLLTVVNSENMVSDISNKISVLDAINWISSAVKEIKSTTVISGFEKAGFMLAEDSEIESTTYLNKLQNVMERNECAEEFVDFDNGLPVCKESEAVVIKTESESDEDIKPILNGNGSMKSYQEVLMNLKDMANFSLHKGNSDLFNILCEAIGNVENCIMHENNT